MRSGSAHRSARKPARRQRPFEAKGYLTEIKWSAAEADDHLISAREGKKMMKAVACRVAVGFSGRGDAAGNHLFGLVRVVRSRFLGSFAGQANGLVVENRKDPPAFFPQRLAAALAAAGT